MLVNKGSLSCSTIATQNNFELRNVGRYVGHGENYANARVAKFIKNERLFAFSRNSSATCVFGSVTNTEEFESHVKRIYFVPVLVFTVFASSAKRPQHSNTYNS